MSILFVLNTVLLMCAAQCFSFLLKNQFYTTGAEQFRIRIQDELKETANMALDNQTDNPSLDRSATATRPDTESMFRKADDFFAHSDVIKFAVLALLIFFAVTECLIGLLLFSAAGRRESADTQTAHLRDIDHIPMYFLLPFFAIMAGVCVNFLKQQTAVLSDIALFFMGNETFNTVLRPAMYIYFLLLAALAFLLHAILTTISVRLRSPAWWRRSILYRAFSGNLDHRVRMTLVILTVSEVGLCLASMLLQNSRHAVPGWVLLLADAAFSAVAALLLYIVVKDMRIYIPATHRIALRKSGYIPTRNLSDSARHHAENINFLSRSASAETEKRYINENFSTKLIHNISHGLREPLKTVAEHVRLLEENSLPPDEERRHIREIDTLSQELKKTIEDLILISKATTGNLPFDPAPTDAGTMLSQAVGEFYEKFEDHGIVPVTEQPPQPVMLLADGQYMWYIFEGVLSVMLELAVPGTRLFLSAAEAGGRAMLRFRCTVCADAEKQIVDLSGMGLSLAKAFTFLQNGMMYDKLSHDTLRVTLLFPKERG